MRRFLLFISLFLFAAFILFSYYVHKGHFEKTDFDLTVKLQNHLPRKLDLPFSILSLIGSAEVTSIFWLFLLVYSLLKRYWLTFFSLFLFASSLLAELYGKVFVYHPSPPFMFYRGALSFNLPSSYIQTGYSYPSGHAIRVTFLVAFLMIYLSNRKIGLTKLVIYLLLLGFLVALYISRVDLGEHWTSDVIGGALLGGSLGILSGLTIPRPRKSAVQTLPR